VHVEPGKPRRFFGLMVKIYLISNYENGKIYIGKTVTSLRDRWSRHLYAAKIGIKNHFAHALRKYPLCVFHMREIDRIEGALEGSELEKLYIGFFQSYRKKYGYNSTLGGEGLVATEEIRKKISTANQGRKHTAISRANMSKAHVGKFDEIASNYRHDILDKDILKLYLEGVSAPKIAKQYGVQNSTIRRRLYKMFSRGN